MTNNTGTVDKIWNFLDEHTTIQMTMSQGLINVRALAKYVIKEEKIDASLDAVISAIRRYEPGRYDKIFENAHKILGQTTALSTRTPLANIALAKDAEVQKLLPKLFSMIHYKQGDVLRIIHADEAIKILVDEKNLEKIKTHFPEDKIIMIDRNLAEINIHQHPDAKYTPGTLAIMSTKLAINGINIIETASCFPEWIWFVDEKDLIKAYNALRQLIDKGQQ